ncbi:MAG: carbohydrate binding domain-containing protein [Bacteroidales bacterium]|nr:carbohydrate binding domain-containing protein [Bacteroidales bacterium]
MLRKIICLLIIYAALIYNEASGQPVDSTTFRLNPRLSFYTFEKSAELLLHIPQNRIYNNLSVSLKINNDSVGFWKGQPGKKLLRLPFNINIPPSDYKIVADIAVTGSNLKFRASSDLFILNYKPNEVKTDRLTGGLIVNKRIFFPFGFYCYSPVYPTLPEEEVVKGFNLMSPYQRILPETLQERKAYMDRCAQLGMKVNYNLLSVSGGGGVSSLIEGITEQQKRERLINEIKAFRDHPALLAWYISDEPTGHGILPEALEKIYQTIREYDPWHPVSIVFMAPFLAPKNYENALDIIMADPYPVPNSPVTLVGDIAGQLSSEYKGRKPVWIVPQVFGGGEWWSREPSVQEVRSMTYQAIIKGTKGIQYFVRQGLNLFPKSTSTWNECGRMAVEIAGLTPWLLSDEETIPVKSGSQNILVTSAIHNEQLLIMAVNTKNYPQKAEFTISRSLSGRARVLFENRNIPVSSGYFSDLLSAFGSQSYMINLKPQKELITPFPGNLVTDPGFEDINSPGVPASCYARNGGDRGATYFLDSREHIEGNHSVRLITPKENSSVRLRFFPVAVNPGRTYIISVWAKADPEQRPAVVTIKNKMQYFEISLGEFGTKQFTLESEWKQFVTFVTIPYNNDLPPRTNIILQMPSAGVAWFDMLQVFEGVDIIRSTNPALRPPWEDLW